MSEPGKEELVQALRRLVGAMHTKLFGSYGSGDAGYEGDYEFEIQKLADVLMDLTKGKDGS